MTAVKLRQYATLTRKLDREVRHLLVDSVDGSRVTNLSQMTNGIETHIETGTEYETRCVADALMKRWTTDEGFKWLSRDELAYESLPRTIALARKMGFTYIIDASFKQMKRPPLNPMGQVALDAWPGMTPKNGGGYEYALGLVTLHARPTPPPNSLSVIAPTGGKEFAEFMLKRIALRNSIGPTVEFILMDN